MGRPKKPESTKKYLQEERKEWDFAAIKGHQKPMAVAWEYARELCMFFGKDAIEPPAPKASLQRGDQLDRPIKITRCLKSTYLDKIYCRFLVSSHWPKVPFLQLGYADLRYAFKGASWPKPTENEKREWMQSVYYSPDDVLDPFFTEGNKKAGLDQEWLSGIIPPIITDLAPQGVFDKKSSDKLDEALLGIPEVQGRRLHPALKLLLVDIDREPWQIEEAFRLFLQKNKKILPRGRSDYERDLSALTIYRLKRFFGSFERMGKAIEEYLEFGYIKPKQKTKTNRERYRRNSIVSQDLWPEYLQHAEFRMGLVKCPYDVNDLRFVGPVFDLTAPTEESDKTE
jgi:hypothetical protein